MVLVHVSYDPKTQGFGSYQIDGRTYEDIRKTLEEYGLPGGTFYVIDNKFFLRAVNGEKQRVAPDAIYYLSTSKAQINQAIRSNNLETLRNLLNPYNVSYLNQADESFFNTATANGNAEALRILISSGLTVKPRNMIIHGAIGTCRECVKVAIEMKAGLNDVNEYGYTPLMRFVRSGSKEIIPLLIQAGADLNVQNKEGFTALYFAVRENDIETVNYLIGASANVHLKAYEGQTPLHLAISRGFKDVAWSLMNSNMDLDVKNGVGQTPLHLAAMLETSDILYFLLLKGANPNIRDNYNRTPLDYALSYGNVSGETFLRQYGAT